jgi:hypothetical protein
MIMLNISNVLELSCICETIGVEGIETQRFQGVTGALLHGDCGALRYFAKVTMQYAFFWHSYAFGSSFLSRFLG